MKRISPRPGLSILLLVLALIGLPVASAAPVRVATEAGGFVEFGSYLGARLLWRVMEINGGHPLLWSEHILSAKCFDAAESGTAGQGGNDPARYGSNLWSRSNLREWLNNEGRIAWSTQPPTMEAIFGNNHYENEEGFLKGFSLAERDLLAKTERRAVDSDGNYVETTWDLVFLACFEEVRDGGRWKLKAEGRKKTLTTQAADQNGEGNPEAAPSGWYHLGTPIAKTLNQLLAVNADGGFGGNGAYSDLGVVPALYLSSINARSGKGTKEDPWRY